MNICMLAALAAALPLMSAAAHAADTAQYPTKPIRLIVPQQAGSSNDTLSRVVTNQLGEALGQQMVVDNRAGVGGIIGMEIGAAAVPDGYTLVSMATAQVIAPYLQKKLAYDTLKDFAPISLYGITYNVLVAHPSVPATNAKEFVALAKAKPGTLNMASAGPGSQSHLAGVMFSLVTGINVLHVPYKGAGASVGAVFANESQFAVTPIPSVFGHIKSGRLKALALSSKKRTPSAPDIPTFIEQGFNFESSGWNGLIAPKNTPKPVIDKLLTTLHKVAATPAFKEQIARQGAEVIVNTPQEFAQFIRAELDKFGPVVKAAKLQAY